jgi:YegS/Rv2252/BmrU family lipid kinase
VSQALLAIVNPAAGGGRCADLAPAALARLRKAGLVVEEVHTTARGHARQLAHEAYGRGVRAFIAVGGDGTAYEIVNGILPQALSAGDRGRVRLGFLPLGTGNSFLRDFSPAGTEHTITALLEGRSRACDVVRLVHDEGELYYINLLSVGFVAEVAAVANRRFKRLGAAGYALAVVLETASLTRSRICMRLDGGAGVEQDTIFVSFCNSRYTGGRMMMAPLADPCDGRLDVIVAGAMGRFALLKAFPRIFSGTHLQLSKISSCHARRVELHVPQAIDLMIDGEVERHLPRKLELLPSAIDVSV